MNHPLHRAYGLSGQVATGQLQPPDPAPPKTVSDALSRITPGLIAASLIGGVIAGAAFALGSGLIQHHFFSKLSGRSGHEARRRR